MVGVFKSGSKWGPYTAFVLPLFSCNLWVPVCLFIPFDEDSDLFIIFSATGFHSGWWSLPRFIISSTGFKRQWYSKFIVSSLVINQNFSKKITLVSSITLCSPRYCLQRKGRKKMQSPFLCQFSEYWVEFLAFSKSYQLFLYYYKSIELQHINVFQLSVYVLFDFQIVPSVTSGSLLTLAPSLRLLCWCSKVFQVQPEYFLSQTWRCFSKRNPFLQMENDF